MKTPLLKKRLLHRCFHMNFVKFLGTALRDCFLMMTVAKVSLEGIFFPGPRPQFIFEDPGPQVVFTCPGKLE